MTVLSAQTIREMCQGDKPLIVGFNERSLHSGMTHGLSSCGYDIRVAEEFYLGKQKEKDKKTGQIYKVDYGRTFLASSVEKFNIPHNIRAKFENKSTLARQFVDASLCTNGEPGWEDSYLTIEVVKHGKGFVHFPAGSPILQVVFEYLDKPTEQPYSGKYQNQRAGAVPAIMAKE